MANNPSTLRPQILSIYSKGVEQYKIVKELGCSKAIVSQYVNDSKYHMADIKSEVKV